MNSSLKRNKNIINIELTFESNSRFFPIFCIYIYKCGKHDKILTKFHTCYLNEVYNIKQFFNVMKIENPNPNMINPNHLDYYSFL